jgi:site-specific DNA recombinase
MPSTNGHGPKSEAERVALYLRVSSEEQVERESIVTQDDFLKDYCKLYGLKVAGVYRDDGVSGTVPMHERPGGRHLLEDAKEGKFEAVLVYKLDRIGRTLLVVLDAHDRLGEAEVALRSATEPIDTSTPAGRLIFQMLASFAEFERSTIAERVRDGMQRAYKNGKQFGAIPYGYDIAEDGAFVVVEEEAQVVRTLFHNIAEGATLYSEAQRLNTQRLPGPGRKFRGKPRRHGARWDPSTIARLIHRTVYSGAHVVHSQKGPVERKTPAIVPADLQQKAIAQLEENKRYSGGKPGQKYLLRGLIRCANCGATYAGTPGKNGKYQYRRYACTRWRKEYVARTRHLDCPRLHAPWIEDLVWQDVREFLRNPGETLQRVQAQMEADKYTGDLEARRASLVTRLADKQAEKGRYLKLYARGDVLDEDELETYLADLKNQIENVKLLITSVEADLAQRQADRKTAADAAAWLISLRERLADIEQDTEEAWHKRHELVKLLVERITVSRTDDGQARIDITHRFGPPPQLPKDEFAHGVTRSSLPVANAFPRITPRRSS